MTQEILERQHGTWQNKPVLRAIYEDYYERIVGACVPDATLEIGGGSGNLKQYLDDVISTDLVPTPWIDAAADAQALPFADASFGNIVGVDVLHHIEYPMRFLAEAVRTLKPDGRLILVEPAITPVSGLFYRWFHPEPVDMSWQPLDAAKDDAKVEAKPDPQRLPFDANQAIPSLLFGRFSGEFEAQFPALRPLSVERFNLLAYPLSGGFRAWSLLPAGLARPLLKLEERLNPKLGKLMGFRLFVVLARQSTGSTV